MNGKFAPGDHVSAASAGEWEVVTRIEPGRYLLRAVDDRAEYALATAPAPLVDAATGLYRASARFMHAWGSQSGGRS